MGVNEKKSREVRGERKRKRRSCGGVRREGLEKDMRKGKEKSGERSRREA